MSGKYIMYDPAEFDKIKINHATDIDEITRLRVENERLREALIRIDGMATTICMKDDAGYGIRAESVMPIYETARAALEGVTEKEGAGNE